MTSRNHRSSVSKTAVVIGALSSLLFPTERAHADGVETQLTELDVVFEGDGSHEARLELSSPLALDEVSMVMIEPFSFDSLGTDGEWNWTANFQLLSDGEVVAGPASFWISQGFGAFSIVHRIRIPVTPQEGVLVDEIEILQTQRFVDATSLRVGLRGRLPGNTVRIHAVHGSELSPPSSPAPLADVTGNAASPWVETRFAMPVPTDGLRLVTLSHQGWFAGPWSAGGGGGGGGMTQVDLLLPDGDTVALDDMHSPPDGQTEQRTISFSNSLLIDSTLAEELAAVQWIVGWRWRVLVQGRRLSVQPANPVTPVFAYGCSGEDCPPVSGRQLPGDCNQDGNLDIADGLCVLDLLFVGNRAAPCEDGAATRTLLDGNGDDSVDLTDAVAVLTRLFAGGPAHVLGVDCLPIADCPERCVAR